MTEVGAGGGGFAVLHAASLLNSPVPSAFPACTLHANDAARIILYSLLIARHSLPSPHGSKYASSVMSAHMAARRPWLAAGNKPTLMHV